MKNQLISILLLINLLFNVSIFAQSSTAVLPDFVSPGCITGSSITLNSNGGSNNIGDTTLFVLTDGDGMIITWDETASFQNLNIGTYIVYAMSYTITEGVQQLSIGNNIQSVTSTCISFSNPYSFNICPNFSDCDYYLGDDVALDTVGANLPNSILQYVLADSNGQIVQISSLPVFTNMQTTGTFLAYALAYENTALVTNLILGNDINTVTINNGCYDWSTPFIFEVCFVENPSVTIQKTAEDTLQAGNTIIYTFTILNNGGTILNNVAFTDDLSNSFEFLSNPVFATAGLQVAGNSIYQTKASLTLNNIPIGTSTFQLYVEIPINTSVTQFCNQVQISGLSANNPNLNDTVQSNQACTIIGKPEDCTDGIDNDLDGLINCADSDCQPVLSGVTVSQPTCANTTGGEIIIATSSSSALEYSITNEPNWQSGNTFSNLGVGQYIVRVRNASGCVIEYSSNPVVLDFNTCTEICNNGIDDDGDGLLDCDDDDCGNLETATTINDN